MFQVHQQTPPVAVQQIPGIQTNGNPASGHVSPVSPPSLPGVLKTGISGDSQKTGGAPNSVIPEPSLEQITQVNSIFQYLNFFILG